MDEGACSNVFDDNKVLFNVQQDNFDEDEEDEDDKDRNKRLEEQLEAFDDCGSEIFNDISDYSPHNSYVERSRKDDTIAERISCSDQHHTNEEITENPVWANDSDHSGNFPSDDQLHDSSTHFDLRMDNVISEESTPSLHAPKIYNSSQYDFGHQSQIRGNMASKQFDFLNSEDPLAQLQCLYETRELELKRVSEELSSQEKEIKSLTLESSNLKGKIEMITISNEGLKKNLSEQESRIRILQKELVEKEESCKIILEENKIIKSKLEVAESTIISLELHVSELTSADCYSKCKEKENKFMQKLNRPNKDDIHNLNLKYRETQNLINSVEKNLQGNENTQSCGNDLLHADEQQMLNSFHDISNYKEIEDMPLLILDNKKLMEKCKMAEKELSHYDMLLKKGIFKSSIPLKDLTNNRLVNNLDIKDLEDSLTRNAYLAFPSQDDRPCNENLSEYDSIKQELVSSVLNNQAYRDEIKKLQEVISSRQKHIHNCVLKHQEREDIIKSDFTEKINILMNDNISIREQNLTFIFDYSVLKEVSEKLLSSILEINEEIRVSPLNLNSSSYLAFIEGLKSYTKALENFNYKQHESWEAMKKNNVHIVSKSQLNLKLTDILGTLEVLRHDFQAKFDNRNSSLFLQNMSILVERFDNVAKDIKDELCHLIEENIRFRNQFVNIQNDYLDQQKEMHNFLKQKEEIKDIYLNFQNQSIQDIKEKLKIEYEVVTNSLKNEISEVSEKLSEVQESYVDVCKEKNMLEKEARFNLSKLASELELCSKENSLLKVNFKNLELKLKEIHKQNAVMVDVSTNTDNHDVQKYTDNHSIQVSQSSQNEISLLQLKVTGLKSILVEQKVNIKKEFKNYYSDFQDLKSYLLQLLKQFITKNNDYNSGDVDYSLSPDVEIKRQVTFFTKQLERYKTMSEKCKIDKSDFEKQIDTKNQQLNYLTSLYITNIIPLTEKSKLHETEKKHLMEKLEQLSRKLKLIENSKQCLIACHEEEIKVITDELQNQESIVKEIKNQWDLKMHEQNKVLHDLGLDREKLSEEINLMKKQNSIQMEQLEQKYAKLKEKYKKLNSNFLKYKNSTDERVDYYLSKAQQFKNSKAELIASYKEYITMTRDNLAGGLSTLINRINELRKNIILKTTDLDFLLVHLNVLYKNLPKLNITET